MPPLLSSACLWARLGISWSLSFLIHKIGSVSSSHWTGPGGGGPATAETSAVLCARQRALGTSPSPRGACPAAPLSRTRLYSVPLGQTRLCSAGYARLGKTRLCSASSAALGRARLCSAFFGSARYAGRRTHKSPSPAPQRLLLPSVRRSSGMEARRPEQNSLWAVMRLASSQRGSGLADPRAVFSECLRPERLGMEVFPDLGVEVALSSAIELGCLALASHAPWRLLGSALVDRGEGSQCCTCFPETRFLPV